MLITYTTRLVIFSAPLFIALLLAACSNSSYPSTVDSLVFPSYSDQGDTVKERMQMGLEANSADNDYVEIPTEITIGLQDVIVSVLKNNSDIRIASHRITQAEADTSLALAPYDPQMFAEWEYSNNSNPFKLGNTKSNNRYYNNTERLGLSQLTPTGGTISAYREWTNGVEWAMKSAKKRSQAGAYVAELTQPLLRGIGNQEVKTNIEISRIQLNTSQSVFKQATMASLQDAIETYWNVTLSREDIKIYEEILEMAKTLLGREKNRQIKGLATELDVERAKEAVATRTTNLINAREQEQIFQERLKFLLNKAGMQVGSSTIILTNEIMETPIVKPNVELSIKAALANRPEIRQAELANQAGKVRYKFASHNLLPQLDLVGSIRDNDSNSHGTVPGYNVDTLGRDWAVGVMLSVPLGNIGARAERDRAKAELQESVEMMDSVEDTVVAEIKTSAKSLELISQEIPQSQLAVKAARRVVAGELARFELNQVGNRDLLQAQDLLAVSERTRVNALIRYNNAIVKLLAAEGTLLEHLGIVIDPKSQSGR